MKFEMECICDKINSRHCQYHQEIADLQKENDSLRESLKAAIKDLDYYSRHNHLLNSTAPNYASETLIKIKAKVGDL